MLSDSDSDGGEGFHQLTINEHYEKAFNARKEREEMWKLEEKLGSEADSTDSEDDEEEDEEGDELTPAADAAIFKTLAKIRDKDPVIYQKDINVFEEEESRLSSKFTGQKKNKTKERDSKPLTIKKHLMNSLLDPNAEEEETPQPPTYVQEQAALRSEMVEAFRTAVDGGNEDEDDDLLVLRTKDKSEEEGGVYADFLQREVGDEIKRFLVGEAGSSSGAHAEVSEEEKEESGKKKKKKKKKSKESDESNSQLVGQKGRKDKEKEDQDFLMNYILNRGWIDKSKDRVPTYKEITGDGDDGELDEIDKEEEFDEVAEEFEQSYNFRFEEPDATKIATYPRTIPSTVRRPNTTRIEARQRREERKEVKLLERREEVKRLKALRVKRMREKLEMIGKEGGIDMKELEELGVDLDGDWDPTKHDEQMAGLYEKEGGDEDEDEAEDDKPTWDSDIDIDDIAPNGSSSSKSKKKKKKKKDNEGDEEDGVDIDEMDANLVGDDEGAEEEWDGTEEMRKRKLDEYVESLYKMEFNDLIGDTPTRFHYAPVPASSFSLTPAEIILADDKDLNSYVSLRKLAPYRKGKSKSGWDAKRAERLQEFRQGMSQKGRFWRGADAGWGMRDNRRRRGDGEEEGEDRPKKKRLGKKERLKAKAQAEEA